MCALVTGVQTCALPIYESCRGDRGHKRLVLSNYGQQRSSAWISRIRTRVTRGQPTAANADDDKHVIEPLTIRDRRRDYAPRRKGICTGLVSRRSSGIHDRKATDRCKKRDSTGETETQIRKEQSGR